MKLELRESCPDCGAKVGQIHDRNCDVQRCTVHRNQRMVCDCVGHDDELAAWTGYWPGEIEAASLGWFTYWGPDFGEQGWVRCDSTHPGARPDLNRWASFHIGRRENG